MSLKILPGRRIEWIDVARGLGIILVVYGHVLRGLSVAGFVTAANPFWASDYAIYTFHMPLFFLLAGLNVQRSMRKGRQSFLISKLWTLAYPYILWSLVQGSIQLLVPAYRNIPRFPWELATILWRPFAQFWFLYALFFCHLIAWACLARRFVIALIAVVALIACHLMPSSIWNAITYVFPFYAAGLFFSSPITRWNPPMRKAVLWTASLAILFALSVHFGRGISGEDPTMPASLPAAFSGIFLLIGISHLIVSAGQPLKKAVEFLGATSLTIYILHVLVSSATRAGLKHFHLDWQAQLALGTLSGILIPAGLHVLFERLGLLSILGLAMPARSHKRNVPVHATELGV